MCLILQSHLIMLISELQSTGGAGVLMLKKTKLLDWIGLLIVLATGLFLSPIYPELNLFPRFGALCVIVALIIAGANSRSVIYEGFDGQDLSKLPSIDAPAEVLKTYKDEKDNRMANAVQARNALFMRVPLWAGIGTFVWGFGDLILKFVKLM